MKSKEEIKSFLEEKPGYLKEGAKRLAEKVFKGEATEEDCAEVLKELRGTVFVEVENEISKEDEFSTEGLILKRAWTMPGGKMGYSYEKPGKEEISLTKEDFKEILSEVIAEEDKVEIEDTKKGKAILNLYLSDKHLGVDTDDGLYGNKYNTEILKERLNDVIQKVRNLILYYGRFAEINIFDLGDSIDGMDSRTTRGGHEIPQNMSNREVFRDWLSAHKMFLQNLIRSEAADKINFINIANSNHGGDMEYMCFYAFKEYVNLKYPNIGYEIYEKFLSHKTIGNHTFIITHGKDERDRFKGLPLNLDVKSENYINEYIDYHGISGNIHLIKGDLHQSNSYQAKKFRYRNCGSMMGSSAWIMSNFGLTKPITDYDIIIDDEILEGKIKHKCY